MAPPKDLMSTEEAAEQLGLSDASVRRLCLEHNIGRKVGRNRVLTPPDVRLLESVRKPVGRPRNEENPAA